MAQRIFSSRSERDGVLATLWFNVANFAIRPWPWILVALATTILYPGLANPREGYVRAVVDLLPAGLLGLMVASFAAAYMSTISTHLNWGASYLARDVYQRFLAPDASERRLVAISRAATTLLLVASLLVTYLMGTIEGAWRFLLAIGAGTGLVLILRWYWWRINAWSEIAAMVASLVTSLALWFGAGLDPGDPAQWAWIMLATVGISSVAWLTVTLLTPAEDESTLVAFYRRVRPGGPGWSRIARAAGYGREPIAGSPFNALNWAAGVVSVYASLFGVGRLAFGDVIAAAPWLALAALAFGWIAWDLRRHPERSVADIPTDDGQTVPASRGRHER